VSKLSAEFLSLQWGLSEGWPVLVARPFNHIGSGQKDNCHRQCCTPDQPHQTRPASRATGSRRH
jgi:nucleoside-diphosphate-sugar epimerase